LTMPSSAGHASPFRGAPRYYCSISSFCSWQAMYIRRMPRGVLGRARKRRELDAGFPSWCVAVRGFRQDLILSRPYPASLDDSPKVLHWSVGAGMWVLRQRDSHLQVHAPLHPTSRSGQKRAVPLACSPSIHVGVGSA